MNTAETALLLVGSGCYAVGAGMAWRSYVSAVGRWILVGAAVFALAIAVRWVAFGQGPFLTMYEILLSSLFSLGLVYGLACLLRPGACRGAPVATLVLMVMVAWLAFTDPQYRPLPATYGNPWLWAHVVLGKIFLGCCLVAASLAATALLKLGGCPIREPDVDRAAWQWLMVAFVFHSGMLVAGAVWAQDAWGRYWAWDPLEAWAFATWLAMVFALHARLSLQLSPGAQRLIIVGVFVLAFLTFFGVPFVSHAPHKGAV